LDGIKTASFILGNLILNLKNFVCQDVEIITKADQVAVVLVTKADKQKPRLRKQTNKTTQRQNLIVPATRGEKKVQVEAPRKVRREVRKFIFKALSKALFL
jgi:hypothetical protein